MNYSMSGTVKEIGESEREKRTRRANNRRNFRRNNTRNIFPFALFQRTIRALNNYYRINTKNKHNSL